LDDPTTNWTSPLVKKTGQVPEPGQFSSLANHGHAVILVGYFADSTAKGNGRFVLRNSWGEEWGRQPSVNSRPLHTVLPKELLEKLPPGQRGGLPPGYGTISAAYIQQHCLEIAYPRPR
jgi:hypothetical protein